MFDRFSTLLGRCLRPAIAVPFAIVLACIVFTCLSIYSPAPESVLGKELFPTLQKKRQPAPELDGGIAWLNTDKPITLADVKGRIVVLDFWTLCCINCIHTLPDLAKLEAKYPGVLVVIGVHSPKFDNEKKTASIFKAILRYEIHHPVINDADHKIWKRYGVNSWPTLGLIDPDGNIVRGYSGEGNYDQLDKDIAALIKEFKGKGTLKETPLVFKLAKEKDEQAIYFPGKVLADAGSDRLFIADSTNHRIVVTTLEGKKIAIAGSGKEGFKDGAFAVARFSDPQGMALVGDTLYVADRKNHSLRALDLKAETVKTVAGVGTQNHSRLGGPGLKTGLNSPWDLLVVNKKIYIAMAGHHQIWTYGLDNKRVEPYAGDGREDIGDGTLTASRFAQPSGLATDGKWLFVADSEISAIRAVSLPGSGLNKVVTIVGEGLFEFGDKDGTGKEVRLQHALGVAYLNGKLYVADTYNDKIKVIDPHKQKCETYLGDGKSLNEPGGLSIANGKMYIADTNNHRIQIVDMKTMAVTTLRLQDVEPLQRGIAKQETK